MKEATGLNSVAEFHRLFNLPVVDEVSIPSVDRIQLRINLLQEELDELKQALADGDKVEMVDALCDIQYVLSGAILEFGTGNKFAELFDEVHRSNMSKACQTREEAEATLLKYKELGQEGEIVAKGDVFLVYRKADGKVLKSVSYSPVDLKDLL